MSDLKHKLSMDAVCFAAQMLSPHVDQLTALVEAERSMHSHLHITDPTLYIEALNSDNLRHQVELARAAIAFVAAMEKVKDEVLSTAEVPDA